VRALVQRVARASVHSDGELIGEIGVGLCALVGVTHTDDAAMARKLAEKIWHLRVFEDDDGVMNRSVADTSGAVLVVSQFTLYGDTIKGRRPSFIAASRPEDAIPLYERFLAVLRGRGLTVEAGEFGADMQVEIHNDGPVTLILDRAP